VHGGTRRRRVLPPLSLEFYEGGKEGAVGLMAVAVVVCTTTTKSTRAHTHARTRKFPARKKATVDFSSKTTNLQAGIGNKKSNVKQKKPAGRFACRSRQQIDCIAQRILVCRQNCMVRGAQTQCARRDRASLGVARRRQSVRRHSPWRDTLFRCGGGRWWPPRVHSTVGRLVCVLVHRVFVR
jgi:hypothetical protein